MAQQEERELELQLIAGVDSNGTPILERVSVLSQQREGHFKLLKSPVFLRNLAAGDIFSLSPQKPGLFQVVERSGKLCIRVFRKSGLEQIEEELTPQVEKLGGNLEVKTERTLVYTIHVNIGFGPVESLFDAVMARFPDSVWYYGNVYDPEDGVSPLNWWHEFLNQT